MSIEYTFSMIKPDATERNITGKINTHFENSGLSIVAQKMVRMSKEQAVQFYSEHKAKHFFNTLISYITSGPVILQVLKGKDAIRKNREIIGATDPLKARNGTIRKIFARSIEYNSIHGSDNSDSAREEINLFFKTNEIVG